MSVVAHAGLGPGRPNSFNLVPVRDVLRGRGRGCPLRAEPARIAALFSSIAARRSLFVRLPDRMRLFATESSDFDDAEIAHVRDVSGQIYADVSRKIAPDDFARDLRKLALTRECAECEQHGVCAGCHAPLGEDVFSRDDARVRELLRSFSGSVLDVGAGEAPYLDELAFDRVKYLGIDPDARRIALLAERHPRAEFLAGTLELLAGSERRFSHVMLLRSYNHLPDPASTLALCAELLEPEGTLLVVDNVAFGLVRSAEHAARAEHSAAPFEHFRNDSAAEAATLLAEWDLELVERRDVGPHTSNQWLLHYKKPNR